MKNTLLEQKEELMKLLQLSYEDITGEFERVTLNAENLEQAIIAWDKFKSDRIEELEEEEIEETDNLCGNCNGSGEGMYSDTSCMICGGSGTYKK